MNSAMAEAASLDDWTNQALAVLQTLVLLVIPLLMAFFAAKRWGRRRFVNWSREALTHANGDQGAHQLVTFSQVTKIATDLSELSTDLSSQHSQLSDDISDRLDVLAELARTTLAASAERDIKVAFIEGGVKQHETRITNLERRDLGRK